MSQTLVYKRKVLGFVCLLRKENITTPSDAFLHPFGWQKYFKLDSSNVAHHLKQELGYIAHESVNPYFGKQFDVIL